MMHPKVDEYIRQSGRWQRELEKLRAIMLSCLLTEEYKWESPCYSFSGANVAGIRGFKEHCALWLFKGALLNDNYHLLTRPGESTQAMRQIRFTSFSEIAGMEQNVREYVFEAIELEKTGIKFQFKNDTTLVLPEEFQEKLDSMPELKTAFSALTPGKQREYARYIAEAKQTKTKAARIEKCIVPILNGKGLNDKYLC